MKRSIPQVVLAIVFSGFLLGYDAVGQDTHQEREGDQSGSPDSTTATNQRQNQVQEIKLEGWVSDSRDKPLHNVIVSVWRQSKAQTVRTGVDGYYAVSVPHGIPISAVTFVPPDTTRFGPLCIDNLSGKRNHSISTIIYAATELAQIIGDAKRDRNIDLSPVHQQIASFKRMDSLMAGSYDSRGYSNWAYREVIGKLVREANKSPLDEARNVNVVLTELADVSLFAIETLERQRQMQAAYREWDRRATGGMTQAEFYEDRGRWPQRAQNQAQRWDGRDLNAQDQRSSYESAYQGDAQNRQAEQRDDQQGEAQDRRAQQGEGQEQRTQERDEPDTHST